MRLKQTWRWYGPNDPVSLQDVRQAGAQGVVTALHHIPHGDVWPVDEILKRKAEVEAAGLTWDVVESVTVHESIKTRTGDYQRYIDLYKQTLRNLAQCGIPIVTYNFMPVNDWTRTQLDLTMADGSKALYFNWFDLAVFDIYILQREGAAASYPEAVRQEAEKRHQQYNQEQLDALVGVVMAGIPGEKRQTVEQMREKLSWYKDIDRAALRENLKYFLQEISPVADEVGIKLAIHPDDPPFDILGLPRIVSRAEDFDFILQSVPNASNGICFCTGSLGAGAHNDLPAIARSIGSRMHFVHLRNVRRDEHGNFYEDDHLGGNVDMYAVMYEILKIQQEVETAIPFRPDHGHQMMDDLNKVTNPGYSCIGRMRGLSELRGLELGICRSEGW
ncbi:mannonate dehydratase [Catalinimonas alkaloidigena]|uniref:Mannonate dehydratase n=1 Tax=Catalinimonas alkaloidigena TaxID=1075417 RepID=A0A1G8Y4U5_9BACT|nr:mannonate dehydratase [Catalinimonas alkaloidigena]SDJ97175.1 mannonate dehydratase [Catalinimonas alkaloidigena]